MGRLENTMCVMPSAIPLKDRLHRLCYSSLLHTPLMKTSEYGMPRESYEKLYVNACIDSAQ